MATPVNERASPNCSVSRSSKLDRENQALAIRTRGTECELPSWLLCKLRIRAILAHLGYSAPSGVDGLNQFFQKRPAPSAPPGLLLCLWPRSPLATGEKAGISSSPHPRKWPPIEPSAQRSTGPNSREGKAHAASKYFEHDLSRAFDKWRSASGPFPHENLIIFLGQTESPHQ